MLDIVRSLGGGVHATTREIFTVAKERHPRIGYSTVYRALLRLRDTGLIAEVNIPGLPSAIYESLVSNHAHFHCQSCGRIEDINFCDQPAQLSEIVNTEHLITSVSLILHGTCTACAETDRAEP